MVINYAQGIEKFFIEKYTSVYEIDWMIYGFDDPQPKSGVFPDWVVTRMCNITIDLVNCFVSVYQQTEDDVEEIYRMNITDVITNRSFDS